MDFKIRDCKALNGWLGHCISSFFCIDICTYHSAEYRYSKIYYCQIHFFFDKNYLSRYNNGMTNIVKWHFWNPNQQSGSLKREWAEVISLQEKVWWKVDSQIHQDRNPVIVWSKLKSPLNRYIQQVLEFDDTALGELALKFRELWTKYKGSSIRNNILGEISRFLPFGDTPDDETPALLGLQVCEIIYQSSLNWDFSESWKTSIAHFKLSYSLQDTSIDIDRFDIVLSYFQKYFLRAQVAVDNQSNAQ